MKNVERLMITITHIYPETSFMVGVAEKKHVLIHLNAKDVYPKDRLVLYGHYQYHAERGRVFTVTYYREQFTELWIAKWLKQTKQLDDRTIVSMIVDKKNAHLFKEELEQIFRVETMFAYCIEQGITEETIAQIEQDYHHALPMFVANPYLLLQYPSISLPLVEDIITRFGFQNPPDARAQYVIEQLLKKANQAGHYYVPQEVLAKQMNAYGLTLCRQDALWEDDVPFAWVEERIYLRRYYAQEQWLADNIVMRLTQIAHVADPSLVDEWEQNTGFTLAKNQKEGVLMALAQPFSVVTGGPGVGKTTVCKCITDLLGLTKTILMVAPTGRAAKRAHESTGLPTSTVHRLLGYDGHHFRHTKENPIVTDVLVIDESSMIDTPLLEALLQATPLQTKIIFVGDVDQLPSVGPGQVLHDLIASGTVPVTRLTEIFRQAADSPIITLAYAVNSGTLPALEPHPDLCYIERKQEEDLFNETITIAEYLYRTQDLFDVQVLIPMYKGPVGIDAVNAELQQRLNPDAKRVRVGTFDIREGDKVIQTKNVKEKNIYNGDVGIVTKVATRQISVRFQGNEQETTYTPESFHELQLSYAVTVHRSQGSEYPFVVIPTVESYGVMLQKNLLYTAITRSKKKLWMLYQPSALAKAVRLDSVPERYTTLKRLLSGKST